MRNSLGDLNNHLFEQIERLNDDDLKGNDLKEEVVRSKAMASIAGAIISNANTVLRAKELYEEELRGVAEMPSMLEANNA